MFLKYPSLKTNTQLFQKDQGRDKASDWVLVSNWKCVKKKLGGWSTNTKFIQPFLHRFYQTNFGWSEKAKCGVCLSIDDWLFNSLFLVQTPIIPHLNVANIANTPSWGLSKLREIAQPESMCLWAWLSGVVEKLFWNLCGKVPEQLWCSISILSDIVSFWCNLPLTWGFKIWGLFDSLCFLQEIFGE
jgi:hypothetical protein